MHPYQLTFHLYLVCAFLESLVDVDLIAIMSKLWYINLSDGDIEKRIEIGLLREVGMDALRVIDTKK